VVAWLSESKGSLAATARVCTFPIFVFTAFSEILLRPNVVPTDAYINSTWWVYVPVVAGFALINVLAMDYPRFRSTFPRDISRFQYVMARLAFVFGFAFCFLVFLQSSLPSVALRFSGSPVDVEMTVAGTNPNKDRKFCVQGIYVAGKPFFADDICDIPAAVLGRLTTGEKIIVSGTGNWMGVIPQQVSLAR
jgi:hypothetical protein